MELSPTAKVVLGMIALGAKTGYDIKRVVERSTRFFWGASYGQIYPELGRLERRGLVKSKSEGARRRKEYRLTPEGERVLRAWLTSSELTFSTRDEALLKAFFGDLVSDDDRVQNARRVIEGTAEALAFFRTIEATGPPADALEYGTEFLEWHLEWWSRYERRLKARARKRPQPGTSAPDHR